MIKKILVLSVLLLIPFISGAKNITGLELTKLLDKWLMEKEVKSNFSILPEIKYPKCDEFEINNISRNFNLIKVSCYGPKEWSFIVRNKTKIKKVSKKNAVKINIKKKSFEESVLVLKRNIKKGNIISSDDLIEKTIIKNKNSFYITEKSQIVGKKLSKSFQAGKPITFSALEKIWMIEKDSNIIIENQLGSITIKVEGVALENADLKQRVKVMNVSSGEILDAYVVNKKKVTLRPKQFWKQVDTYYKG